MRISFLAKIFLSLSLLLPMAAQALELNARAAFVVDYGTGTVLFERNADTPLPPASMSKLMTLLMVFEALDEGRLTLSQKLPVSQHAMSYGGSTMFLDTTDRVVVEDLIRGVIVLSGNDACAVLAEALSPDGTEDGFARLMTDRARQIGMMNSTFANSNGWPAAGHRMSVRDLATLTERLISNFPQYYPLFSEREFKFDGRAPANSRNRNPLLGLGIGADGLKTGHTQEAGYGLVGSAVQGDRRVIFVLSGMNSTADRASESEKVVNWAFRQFVDRKVADKDAVLAQANVWLGSADTVGLVAPEDIHVLLPVPLADQLEARVDYTGPIQAPIKKGQILGTLVLPRNGLEDFSTPLVADRDVGIAGFIPRLKTSAQVLMRSLNEGAA
ncbi:MAG: D-alanyl-D-alanine carboxypeptidase, partial [Paracoccaceae bacterium]|nr:D-alanyl-D-alanine carboxypeptidase [Paracoccaceae bacterium]